MSTNSSTHPPKGNVKSIMVKFFLKRIPLIENVRIKSLTCFKHQINVIVVIFVLWKFPPSNQLFSEWSIENIHSVRSIF